MLAHAHEPEAMSHEPCCDVLIIGAGITGLTAAHEIARRGLRPLLLEASPRSGGLIRTDRLDGFTIEAGPDSVLTTKPAAIELARELGLEANLQAVRPPGGAFVLRGTQLHPLPRPSVLGIPQSWSGLARYTLLPPAARARLALEPLVPARRDLEDESIGSFFRRRFGRASVDLIAQPLLGGIHAGDIETLSMRSLFPKLLVQERTHGSILGAPGASSASAISPFVSLRGGMDTLVQALERRLGTGAFRHAARVDRIERTAAGWRTGTDEARALILAVPAHAAASLLAPIDAVAANLCAQVPYVSTVSVALAWPSTAIPQPLTGTGFVVARRHSPVRITACTWVSSKWDDRAPEGAALLRVFLGGAHDPDAVSMDDAALVSVARTDLGRVLGVTAEPSLARVYRWPNAGALHLVGHLSRVEAIERRLGAHGGLFVAGSGFRSVGIPDCVADARRVAGEAVAFVETRSRS
jgi:oxygen-dependent protoporphyrinogen oxidase